MAWLVWGRPDTFSAAVSGAAAAHSGQAQQGLCPAFLQAGFCARGDACPLTHGHFCQVLSPHHLPHSRRYTHS